MKLHPLFFYTILLCLLASSSCGRDGNTRISMESFVTTSDRKLEFAHSIFTTEAPDSECDTLFLNPSERFQSVEGFGPALTGASCYNLLRMPPKERKELLFSLFSPDEGLGINVVRVSIGASDFSVNEEFTWCDREGLENFSPHKEDVEYLFPILKEVYRINPGLKIIASPWSAPRWMKIKSLDNPEPHYGWTSGQLNPEFYSSYASYFVKWVTYMESMGFNIFAITIQNEPLHRGNSMSMYMGWEEQRDFIKTALGPAFEKAGLKTRILVFDHNYNYDGIESQQGYPANIFADSEASKYVAGTAWHNYRGDVSEISAINSDYPEKEAYFTEASIGLWNYDFGSCLLRDFDQIFIQTLQNGCRAVTLWNLMLDDKLGPYRPGGCSTCHGALTISSEDGSLIDYKSQYFNIAHSSKVVRSGALRIGSISPDIKDFNSVAFLNPDGSYAILSVNYSSEAISLNVTDGESLRVRLDFPAESTSSFRIFPHKAGLRSCLKELFRTR